MAAIILDEVCSSADLKRCESQYRMAMANRTLTPNIQFQYAWCLVRTDNKHNLQTGANLLEYLFRKSREDSEKRDYLYYMVIGYTKLKEYERALKYADGILKVQPNNHQVKDLKVEINKRMKKDGMIGMAVAGGAAAAVGVGIVALIGAAIAGSKR